MGVRAVRFGEDNNGMRGNGVLDESRWGFGLGINGAVGRRQKGNH